jgi:hypothetical protein
VTSRRRRTASGRYYRWREVVAELKAVPGRWVLVFPHHPAILAKHVRLRRAPELQLVDARIDAQSVNKYTDYAGKTRADIWLRYTPIEVGSGVEDATQKE